MSLAQPGQADLRPTSTLSLSLSSNNPFRNRAVSPSLSDGPRSPFAPPPRPVSRNPFLDASATNIPPRPLASPDKMAFGESSAPPRPALTGNAADLFDNLTLNDKPLPSTGSMRPPPPRPTNSDKGPPPYSARGENVPPRGPPRGPPGHRPSKSQEEAMRARRTGTGSSTRTPARGTGELDIFADPTPESASSPRKPDGRRPRRNSDSSVRDAKPLDSDEEKKRQERRRRERERRHRERDSKDPKSKKPDRKLDIIDKLDVTSIYGTGLFHHDGPFDACNPHRNRQGSKRAPMQAFPKDSLNNVLGGGGPLNKRPDHAAFLGNNDEEAFKDYSNRGAGYDPYGNPVMKVGAGEPAVMSATTRVEPIHGEETLGLGTSTFLEGAPASRTAMQRREAEQQQSAGQEGGLGRKKSLAQKIRGINTGRRDYGPSGRITSPEGVYSPEYHRTPGGSKSESNPFFNEFSKGDDVTATKKDGVAFVEPERIERNRGPSSPKRGYGGASLERRVTSDGSPGSDGPAPKNNGFLSRVKSLKGGPRKPKSIPQAQES